MVSSFNRLSWCGVPLLLLWRLEKPERPSLYVRSTLTLYCVGRSRAFPSSLQMMHEIAVGMAYLHRKGVLHGDLKVPLPHLFTLNLIISLPYFLLVVT